MPPRKLPYARFAVGQDGLARAQSVDPVPAEAEPPVVLAPGRSVHLALRSGKGAVVPATITTVGRAWVSIELGSRVYRFARPTGSGPLPNELPLDGRDHSSPGTVVFDLALRESESERQRAWSDLRSIFDRRYQVPAGVTTDMIAAARKALGL